MDLETVADELYGEPPGQFTAARDGRAAEAKRAGDRELAAAIGRLRRPTTSAWLANLLARERPKELGELLELGVALRAAQSSLDREDLRRLSTQRHRVVAALAREARRLAADAGQPVSDDVEREVEGTLEAALADPAAGDALRSGRLTGALRYSGLGGVEVAGGLAAAAGARAPAGRGGSSGRRTTAAPGGPSPDQLAAAEEALRAAQTAATAARQAADERDRALTTARARHEQLLARVDELAQELQRSKADEVAAVREVREAQRARDIAERAAAAALEQVRRAESALARDGRTLRA